MYNKNHLFRSCKTCRAPWAHANRKTWSKGLSSASSDITATTCTYRWAKCWWNSFSTGLYNLSYKSRAAVSDKQLNSLSGSIYCRSDPEVWAWEHEGASRLHMGTVLRSNQQRRHLYQYNKRILCIWLNKIVQYFTTAYNSWTVDKFYLYSLYHCPYIVSKLLLWKLKPKQPNNMQ